jgi:putative AbiEii toxin of type IV toxin-antitoxin system
VSRGRRFRLNGTEVGGFKSAIQPVAVRLRPLTVLAGQNSAGKSTVIQPLLLLKQTMERPFDPGGLAIDGPLVQFTNADQFFSHSPAGRANEFFVKLSSEDSYVTMYYQRASERGVTIDRMEFTTEGNEPQCWRENDRLSAEAVGVDKEFLAHFRPDEKAEFIVRRDRAMLVAALEPTSGEQIAFGLAEAPAHSFLQAATQLIHLPGLRGNPERNYRITAVGLEYPGNFSEYVASIIHRWQSTHDKKLRTLAGNLRDLGLTWKVQTRPIDDTRVEIIIGRLPAPVRGGARDTISIADVGFGVSQTLPVLVALLAASSGQFVFIEQPEIHLHPKAQVGLANLLLDAVNRGANIIVETHSSLLVLAVQDLIAEGKLDPNKVSMNWFTRDPATGATRATEAVLGEDGSYGEWPADFGSIELELQARYMDSVDRRTAVKRNIA